MMKISLSPKKDIRFTAILISLLFSIIVLAYHQPTNGDALTYFRSSLAYGYGGFSEALKYYPWPFFSIMLDYISSIFHISILNAGILLNTGLCALLVWAFISIAKEMGGNYRIQCIAALVILLYPYINHFRDNILRDMGYWAFYLTAFLYLLRYSRKNRWCDALLWNLCIVIATTFRIEGIIFAALAPLFLLFKPTSSPIERCVSTLKVYAIPLVFTVLGLLAMLALGKIHALQGARLDELFLQIQSGISQSITILQKGATNAVAHVLPHYGKSEGMTFVVSGVIGIIITQMLSNVGPVYCVLTAHGYLGRYAKFNWDGKAILISFVIINMMINIMFITQHLFISKRYTTALSLLLLFFVVYSIAGIIENYQLKRKCVSAKRGILILLIIGLSYNLIAGLGHFGTNKSHIVDAGKWLKAHSPSDNLIFSNTSQVVVYSERTGEDAWDIVTDERLRINNRQRKSGDKLETRWVFNRNLYAGQNSGMIEAIKNRPVKYDYLVLELNRDKDNTIADELESAFNVELSKTFSNKKGDRILIYKVLD